ncbi:hypothetical protein G4V62_10075 [Bacillaceae bacterium SIJ1]|uniref:cytochrome bd oxidase small subunit CydS n=1 Tax=Litoribacterium kuwaitense TaxID=1398745 RepID=UPI0013EB7C6B|nr:hypothetical protein [Litoribacterium kuwaitense]NGP45285.1 hypothetical protein [Litoribacterium kuwaitense]
MNYFFIFIAPLLVVVLSLIWLFTWAARSSEPYGNMPLENLDTSMHQTEPEQVSPNDKNAK